ncbi:HAAS signaling domain-containing protein [Dactylosporangium cerinum]
MTEAATIEIDYYYERVAAALADLPEDTRDELLEDLPAHFAEVLEEQGGPLVDRLGPPATYAAELRAAAGLDTGPAPDTDRAPLVVYYERLVAALPDLDKRAGKVIGYPRATEFLRLLRPPGGSPARSRSWC